MTSLLYLKTRLLPLYKTNFGRLRVMMMAVMMAVMVMTEVRGRMEVMVLIHETRKIEARIRRRMDGRRELRIGVLRRKRWSGWRLRHTLS